MSHALSAASRASSKQAAVAWAELGADELGRRERQAADEVRAVRARVAHSMRGLMITLFEAAEAAQRDDARVAAGGRFFK